MDGGRWTLVLKRCMFDCIPAVTCAVALATTACASSRAVRSHCRAASSKRARSMMESIASLRAPERNLLRQSVLDIGNKIIRIFWRRSMFGG